MVFPGAEDTRAKLFLPSRVLTSELFPTLDLPDRATCGMGSRGNWSGLPALRRMDTFCRFSGMTASFLK